MEQLNKLLQDLGISKVRLAKYLGVSRQMVYNYLELEDINKWPKEKKILLFKLLDIDNGDAETIENIKVSTEYLLDVENRIRDFLNRLIKFIQRKYLGNIQPKIGDKVKEYYLKKYFDRWVENTIIAAEKRREFITTIHAGDTQVHQTHIGTILYHDVRRLDITMNDTTRVDIIQSIQH